VIPKCAKIKNIFLFNLAIDNATIAIALIVIIIETDDKIISLKLFDNTMPQANNSGAIGTIIKLEPDLANNGK